MGRVLTGTYQGHVSHLREAVGAALGGMMWEDVLPSDGRLKWVYECEGEEVACLYARPIGDIVECELHIKDPELPQVIKVDFRGCAVWIDSRHSIPAAEGILLTDGIISLLEDRVLAMINAGSWLDSDGAVDRFGRYHCWPTEAQARAYFQQQVKARMTKLTSKLRGILTPVSMEVEL